MEELGKITKSKDVSLETKVKVIQTLMLPITMYRCEIWTVNKADRKKKWFHLNCVGGELYEYARKMVKWVLEQTKPEVSLEVKKKLTFLRHIMKRQSSLEKPIILGKIEGSKKRMTKYDMN